MAFVTLTFKRSIASTFFCCVLQIDLGRLYRVCGLATQGNPGGNKDYLKEYKLKWSNDGITWETSAEVCIHDGVKGSTTEMLNTLDTLLN